MADPTDQKSKVEEIFLSPTSSNIVGVVGLVFTVAFAFFSSWPLAIAIGIASTALIVAPAALRAYSRQLRHRYEDKEQVWQNERAELLAQKSAAVEALHRFIHMARDRASNFMSEYEKLADGVDDGELDASVYQNQVSRLIRDFLQIVLEEMLRVFVPLVPPSTNLWVAIRELRIRPGEQKRYYHTLLRTGCVNHDRGATSEPIAEDDGLARHLRQQHELGHGIVILRRERPGESWRPSPNDSRHEDADLMAGPIFLKSTSPPEMLMILTVNSPVENVFQPEHVPYMKCCTDVLSMFFNMISSIVLELHQNA